MLETIDRLGEVGSALSNVDDCTIHFDLAELRGYQYHNGIVFAAYVADVGVEVARGGRYDGIGGAFGRTRPATGYSTDLKNLMRIVGESDIAVPGAIEAPSVSDPELERMIENLRAQGEVVVSNLGGQNSTHCDRRLIEHNGKWLLENC
jgi:ATP phosphoribosyltransferase regulatory subunit